MEKVLPKRQEGTSSKTQREGLALNRIKNPVFVVEE